MKFIDLLKVLNSSDMIVVIDHVKVFEGNYFEDSTESDEYLQNLYVWTFCPSSDKSLVELTKEDIHAL